MQREDILKGIKILIVDDEPDILRTLQEVLDSSILDPATDFEAAKDLLEKNTYDAAILDIMGVRGYELLALTRKKGIPTLMLTAHALSPENLVASLKKGANAYIPKDKIADIRMFLEDVLEDRGKGHKKLGRWFSRLEPFFEEKFGAYWKEKSDPEFWKKYY
ncbi:MAG: response regulator [Deltaproteobacteria bacterium]|nr:response regulator [Deltaproteobacteria bacterium]MBW2016528.1 response regulator [Deltaproteobacteria bacterium]MBW2128708.1 response regulator [Deltaproteobacteria bacterium]MBW2302410.1 response regulator [Deltaproteobacteria bacterium]